MAPTPSIIWRPLALWLTRPLRPETECSISSEPSPPTSPSPSPLAQLLWPQEWEQQLGWGGHTEKCSWGTHREMHRHRTLQQHRLTQEATRRRLESQREKDLKSSDVGGTCELAGSPGTLSSSLSCPPGPSLQLVLLPAGIKQSTWPSEGERILLVVQGENLGAGERGSWELHFEEELGK